MYLLFRVSTLNFLEYNFHLKPYPERTVAYLGMSNNGGGDMDFCIFEVKTFPCGPRSRGGGKL